jgi:hypothetical protein
MRNIIIAASLLMMILLSSCRSSNVPGKRKLQPADYVQWIESKENGLKVNLEDKPYIYELQYQPIEYLAVMQLRNPQILSSALKEEMEKRGDLQYFTLTMRNEKNRGILSDKDLEIENKSSYLLSGLQKDMMMLSGQDTLRCVMLHFESANNLVPYDLCVLAFEPSVNYKEDIVFLLRTDKYKKGWVRMTIKRKDIKMIPKLKTI